jgi:hypothetical protein
MREVKRIMAVEQQEPACPQKYAKNQGQQDFGNFGEQFVRSGVFHAMCDSISTWA